MKERRWVNTVYRKLSGQAEGVPRNIYQENRGADRESKYSTCAAKDERLRSV